MSEQDLMAAQTALEHLVQVVGDDPNQGREPEILDGRHRGQRPVTASRGQKRDVVSNCLIAIASAQVEDFRAAQIDKPSLR